MTSVPLYYRLYFIQVVSWDLTEGANSIIFDLITHNYRFKINTLKYFSIISIHKPCCILI